MKVKIPADAVNRSVVKQIAQQFRNNPPAGSQPSTVIIRLPLICTNQIIGIMIKRPDVPASDDVFSIFVFGNDRNISGIAGIAESHREHAFVPQISGNVQIMHRSQRRTLAAGHNIIGTEIVDDRNTGQVSQKPRIADLNRIGGFAAGNGWRK